MKLINIVLGLIAAVVLLLVISVTKAAHHEPRYAPNANEASVTVVLPEEGNIAEAGDSFIVEKVSNDTIYLGYSYDYRLELDSISIKVMDGNREVYREITLDGRPTALQLALYKDNE